MVYEDKKQGKEEKKGTSKAKITKSIVFEGKKNTKVDPDAASLLNAAVESKEGLFGRAAKATFK